MSDASREGAVTTELNCDLLVIGAGPAGGMTALLAARRGLQVTLVDGKSFPRPKVCGGCLNPRAVRILHQQGFSEFLARSGGVPLRDLTVFTDSGALQVPLPTGFGLSRMRLDQELVRAAVSAGVQFIPETTAKVDHDCVDDERVTRLISSRGAGLVRSRIVVVADGLLRSSVTAFPEFSSRRSSNSRIGLGATLIDSSPTYPAGRIHMAVSREGYVGIARLEEGLLNLACALDPKAIGTGSRPVDVVSRILTAADAAIPAAIQQLDWTGTPLLTSRPGRVAGQRIFLIGDSAGYVEPFTGEGISAALECALELAPLLPQACRKWDDQWSDHWVMTHRRLIARRQWICRLLAGLLRNPFCVRNAMHLCRWFPAIPQCLASQISSSVSVTA